MVRGQLPYTVWPVCAEPEEGQWLHALGVAVVLLRGCTTVRPPGPPREFDSLQDGTDEGRDRAPAFLDGDEELQAGEWPLGRVVTVDALPQMLLLPALRCGASEAVRYFHRAT